MCLAGARISIAAYNTYIYEYGVSWWPPGPLFHLIFYVISPGHTEAGREAKHLPWSMQFIYFLIVAHASEGPEGTATEPPSFAFPIFHLPLQATPALLHCSLALRLQFKRSAMSFKSFLLLFIASSAAAISRQYFFFIPIALVAWKSTVRTKPLYGPLALFETPLNWLSFRLAVVYILWP